MATKIRLKRLGKIRSPHYRIVVIDSRSKRDGKAIEEIGQYHPKNDPSVIQVNSERVQYWLGVGAQPTEAVVAILKRTGDWQQFSGDKTPAGVDPQPEKADKLERFNAALAEADDAPKAEAISKKAAKSEDAPAETAEATEDDAAEKPVEESAEAPAEGAADASTEA
ncbi:MULTISPECIES: 30S ribosomal protein S16 [unclassified Luteococcus]|uniref:30S ribosomal protein S16 n=1 Tax=unclassified Luteococcus TaxID=2639923 RepID=UPI00313D0725